jgi:hypothetical protein
MRQGWIRAMIFTGMALTLTGCVAVKRDRCYLAETRYIPMRQLFEETGSYQRVAQALNDEGWAHCEINSFRYRLREELQMEGEEFDELFITAEPNRRFLDFNPGRVEAIPRS